MKKPRAMPIRSSLPWDTVKGGTGYTLRGHELERRDMPAPKSRR